jgi:hypothetical protein
MRFTASLRTALPAARSTLLLSQPVHFQHVSSTSWRSYTAASKSTDVTQKPKAMTPLRRTAPSASAPIRSNPTPTRSEIQSIFTYATAERYWLPSLRGIMPQGSLLLHDAYWVPKWEAGSSGKHGEVFVFANGSFVCWGLSEKDAERFRRQVLQPAGAEIGLAVEPETEELEFVTDPSECVCLIILRYFAVLTIAHGKRHEASRRSRHSRKETCSKRSGQHAHALARHSAPCGYGAGTLRVFTGTFALDIPLHP